MAITDLTVFQALREKLKFHEHRQRVLAENIANASTPGYQGRDLERPDFFRMAAEVRSAGSVTTTTTKPGHLSAGFVDPSGKFRKERGLGYETTPDGNAVVLEEQMMKIADNQMDYQVASSLYQRSLGLLKTAVGRR